MRTIQVEGSPSDTFTQSTSNDVQRIASDKLHRNGDPAVRALILCESNAGRYAFGADPAQGGLGYPTADGDLLDIRGFDAIQRFGLINEADASQVDMTITIFYDQ